MSFFDFLTKKGKAKPVKNRLYELLKKNLNETDRDIILTELCNHKLVIGTKEKLPDLIDSYSSITYLSTVSPDGKGKALMSFINDEGLFKRNKSAFPALFDIHAINLLLEAGDLDGIIIIHDFGWCFLDKDELMKTAVNHT